MATTLLIKKEGAECSYFEPCSYVAEQCSISIALLKTHLRLFLFCFLVGKQLRTGGLVIGDTRFGIGGLNIVKHRYTERAATQSLCVNSCCTRTSIPVSTTYNTNRIFFSYLLRGRHFDRFPYDNLRTVSILETNNHSWLSFLGCLACSASTQSWLAQPRSGTVCKLQHSVPAGTWSRAQEDQLHHQFLRKGIRLLRGLINSTVTLLQLTSAAVIAL